jgi:putative aldouronate transport system substrate-binding protein
MQSIIAGATANGWDVEMLTGLDGNSHYRADPYLNNGVALAANTKNAALALQALDRIIEDKSYNFLVYFGIEGRNYVVKNNMIALPDGVTADKNTYPPDAAGFWFTNKDQFPPFATWTPAYVQHRRDIVTKGFLVPTPFVAFSANTDDVKTEVANVNQTMVQYLQPLWIGISDNIDASFATLDRKLKAAGVEKLRQTFQGQVDQYMKRL